MKLLIRFLLPFTLLVLSATDDARTQVPSSALPIIDSLEKKIMTSDEDSNRVKIFMDLLNTYVDFDISKASEYAWQANSLSKKIGYSIGEGRSLYSLAGLARSRGNYLLADSLYAEAEKKFVILKRDDRIAMLINERGNLYFMQGNYWLAGDYYTKATEGFEKLKDTVNTIISYQNLIAVLGETQNYKKAIELANKILPLAEKTTDTSQVYYILQSLLVNNARMGNLDSAANYVKPLLDFATTPDYYIAAEIYGAVGEFYKSKKENKEALVYLNKAVEKAKQIDNQFLIANMLKSAGAIYFEMGNGDSAFYYYTEAMKVAQQSQNRRAQYETTKLLSDFYAAKGNNSEAYRYLAWHLQIKDSILESNVSNHVTYLEAKFENNKKEKQISELQLRNIQKELLVVKRNRLLIIGSISAAAVMILLGFMYRHSKNKQIIAEKEQKLKEEQIKFLNEQQQVVSLQSMINGQETERTRIAKDLHDGLGGLFSTVKMHLSTLQHDVPELKGNQLFGKSYELVDNASVEVRRIAHNMMPEVLIKLGLADGLNDMCNNISSGKLLKVTFQAYGMDKRLNASTEIMLYRIIQELLNNIIKHSQATEVLVQFNRNDNRLHVNVEDNGRGFNTLEADGNNHAGLETVQSRVDYLDGKLSIESQQGLGTTIMMEFLIKEE
ncbi:MAG: tetratricopeptide repeat protein [Bacteroidota bacterium]|nr:tetratricopeptide repeat protein [Bacteroidota bacterium]